MGAMTAAMIELLGYDPDAAPVPVRPKLPLVTVPPNTVVAARDGDRDVAVARLASGMLIVVDDACPHDGGPISDGFVEGEHLVCARHGWELSADAAGKPCRRVCKL